MKPPLMLQTAPLPTSQPPALAPLPPTTSSTSRPVATSITVAPGDGIGPEITEATLRVLRAAGATFDVEQVSLGKAVYAQGISSGVPAEAWESLRRTGVLLKGPITTPQGGGYKSVNVTLRKSLGLFANVRPCVSYPPYVETRHPAFDLIVVRENEEDVYGGIEHRQTNQVTQCLKLITRPGSERLIRYAFELARREGRQRVTCMTKDNILKHTDGLFHQVFEEVARDYPDLVADHMIVDIGAARVAAQPGSFDVIVTPNLYGDIISDIAAEVAGSVGMAPSSNMGLTCAMFEAVHGSAPDIAGRGIANPSGLLLAGVQLLEHIGQGEVAHRIREAWLTTIERGLHTADVFTPGRSAQLLSTQEFADAVIANLGERPERLVSTRRAPLEPMDLSRLERPRPPATKTLHGVDVFLDWTGAPEQLGARLARAGTPLLPLQMITNRGVQVWPQGRPETLCVDHWRCRFLAPEGGEVDHALILQLLQRVLDLGYDFIKTEHLCAFDGTRGFSMGQGQ